MINIEQALSFLVKNSENKDLIEFIIDSLNSKNGVPTWTSYQMHLDRAIKKGHFCVQLLEYFHDHQIINLVKEWQLRAFI